MFHLSKRLFSEAALKSQHIEVCHKRLNIISSDYVEDSLQFIAGVKKLGALSRQASVSAMDKEPKSACGRKRDKDLAQCISCSAQCYREGDPSKGAAGLADG